MSPSINERKAPDRHRRAALVVGCVFALSTLIGCSATITQPILPGTPVIKLLPTKATLDKFYGSRWEQTSAPKQLDPSEMTITKKADPTVFGEKCAKAQNDFDASFIPKDGADVRYDDKGSNTAGLTIYRMPTVAKATAIVKELGAVDQACEDSPGTDIQPVTSSIPGAVGYGSAAGTTGKPYGLMAIADGDLVIMASAVSTAQADKELQLELDTIAALVKG